MDVDYANLVEDPLFILRKIYDFAAQPLTPDAEAAFMRILALNRQHKNGKHQYQLSDFGFHEDVVKETYHF